MPIAEGYLVVSKKSPDWKGRLAARWLEKRPKRTNPSEILIGVLIEVPDQIFERPQLTAVIKVEKADVPPSEITKTVMLKAEQVLQAQTGLRVEFLPEKAIAESCAACMGKGSYEANGVPIICPDCKGTGLKEA
jgi:hypothetical protein